MHRRPSGRRLPVVAALVFGTILGSPSVVPAQCAMCGTAAASSSGVARGIALSVFFLLGTLFLVVGWLVVLVLRSQARTREAVARLPAGHAPAEK